MRPRFERFVPCSPAQVQKQLKQYVERSKSDYVGQFYANHALLNVPPEQERFWSPQLTLDFETQRGGTLIRGLYSPRPSVWTMFMAMYAILGFGGIIGVLFGASQWSIGMRATGLWAAPIAVVLAGCVYLLALLGQWLSRDQITALRSFAEGALRSCE